MSNKDTGTNFLRSSLPEVFCKKGILRNFTKFTGKHLCQSIFFNKVEFCEISKNTFFHRTSLAAASEIGKEFMRSYVLCYHKI